jgi:predicted nucleic acid-binding protein
VTAVVLDSSAALTWCFEDEVTAETEALLERVRTGGAVVPRLWHLEIVNALLVGERRGRLQFGRTATLLGLLASLPIVTDDETGGRAFGDTLHLARAHALTAYDASYLELALRRNLPLATLDDGLGRAAARSGVPLVLVRR